MKKNINLIYILFLLFPIINLITGLMTRYLNFALTLGIAIRIALLLFLVMYVFFLSKSKYKKITIIYFIVLATFGIIHLAIRPEYFNLRALYNEFNLLFKFMYFPILLLGMLNLYNEYGIDKKKWKKIMLFGLIFYIIFIILPILTKTSFNSYGHAKTGLVGWFYAANEVGPIMLMLFPITFTLLEKHKIAYVIISILGIFTILGISTKVCTLGLGIVLLFFAVPYIFSKKKLVNKTLLVIVIGIYILLFSPFGENIYYQIEQYNNQQSEIDNNTSQNPVLPQKPSVERPEEGKDFLTVILSNRNLEVIETNKEFMKANLIDKMFGLGFYSNEKQNVQLIEMDFFDIFYRFGIVGFLLLILPYIYMFTSFIKNIKNKSSKFSFELFYSIIIFLLMLGISFLAGHVIGSPAVSTYLAIYGLYILALLNPKEISIKNE